MSSDAPGVAMEPADHPRPQLRRAGWVSLDGPWTFALDPQARWRVPAEVGFDREIRVPFAPEAPMSGVGDTSAFAACWYRRTFTAPALAPGERLFVRFGAVDHEATVWVNGREVARHEGGYTPFSAEVTQVLAPGAEQELVVRAYDHPLDLEKPRGKQDWRHEPHAIWYPRTTGIWQTVWLETVPATAIGTIRWRASVLDWALDLDVGIDGEPGDGLRLELTLRVGDTELARDDYALVDGEARRRVALPDPGIHQERRELLWRPQQPVLIDAELVLRDGEGRELDRVASYTAMRSVGVEDGRFLLNERPVKLRLVLDQGYWPESGLTPPDLAAVRRDVELVKALGFNGVRKHQKVEDPRFLRVADELGLLVWAELPAAYRFTRRSARRLTAEWLEVLERDASHPCVVAWLPFNESWGVPDVARSAAQRDLVAGLFHLTKAIDPDRPVVGNDGWEFSATDLLGVHDYEQEPARLAARLGLPLDELVERERPHGRRLLLDPRGRNGRPVALTEFGGIALAAAEPDQSADGDGTWGYERARDSSDLLARYRELLVAVHGARELAGFCYTQLTDTHQEANGLLRADRSPKAPLEALAQATRGPLPTYAEPPDHNPASLRPALARQGWQTLIRGGSARGAG